ncbi:MAG: Rpn family recombination-promoting nuclease/putative transposase, partial [bacterium]|nr:Rpn family recombination-promoting nuclease/putative transposase [bacterium]
YLRMQREETERKDLVEKDIVAFPDVAADVLNALLFDGESIVSAAELVPVPTETLYSGDNGKRLRNQYEDLAKYEMWEGQIRTMYLFANQTQPDSLMLLRKAGYIGGAYREQYEGKAAGTFPVVELILYWGEEHWHGCRSISQLFSTHYLPPKLRDYIDNIRLHVWEMRHLSQEMRERFHSDMRIVLDYLKEGNNYRSNRPVVHKAALIRMIKVLSGNYDIEEIETQLGTMNIKEEEEITVCDLFEQYERKGRSEGLLQGRSEGIREGIQVLILTCRDMKLSFGETAEKVKKGFQLDDTELKRNMELYWPE